MGSRGRHAQNLGRDMMAISRRSFLGWSSAAMMTAGTVGTRKVNGMMKDDWKLNHVGLVVRDWENAMGYYQTTGMGITVGPQIVALDFQEQASGPTKFFLNDKVARISGGSGPGTAPGPDPSVPRKSSTYKFMDKNCQVGNLLLEVLRDRSIPFEGVTHLCFNVPDVKKETDKLLEKGCEIVLSFTQGDFIAENYIDTREFGHVIVSFRPPVQKWEKKWTAHNRAHPLLSDWQFHGLGIAVRDLDKAVEYYQSLDIAEFQPEAMLDSGALAEATTPDTAIKARTRVAQIGPVAYELVQPLEGEAIYQESLDSRGEGISDMAFTVGNLEDETAKLAGKGVQAILSGKPASGNAFAYFDTREFGGNVMIRLIQR